MPARFDCTLLAVLCDPVVNGALLSIVPLCLVSKLLTSFKCVLQHMLAVRCRTSMYYLPTFTLPCRFSAKNNKYDPSFSKTCKRQQTLIPVFFFFCSLSFFSLPTGACRFTHLPVKLKGGRRFLEVWPFWASVAAQHGRSVGLDLLTGRIMAHDGGNSSYANHSHSHSQLCET